MDSFQKDLIEIYDLMVWEKEPISPKDEKTVEDIPKEIIKIDANSNFGNKTDKIAIILVKPQNVLPDNPIVVFGHGNGERAIDYLWHSENFCKYGVSICCVDYRGYGYADGSLGTGASEPDDMISVINYLKSIGYQKISYFGFSLGARCGLYVASYFPDLVCVCLDSPWLSNQEWSEHKAKKFAKIDRNRFEKVLPEVYKKIYETTGNDFTQVQEAREIVHKIKQPLFLFHGSTDQLVPYSNSKELFDLVQSEVKFFKTHKIGHNYCLKRYEIWNEMTNFILKQNGIEINE